MILDYLKGQMEKLEELLPGIEVYLCETLAAEKLSSDAEDRRQYFLERLDILKLPPSRPPRSSVSHLKHDEAEDETVKQRPASPINLTAVSEDSDSPVTPGNQDFAARQRELSRTLLTKSGDESEDDEEAKVYDDIGDEDSEDSEQRVYEVPVTSASNDDLSPSSEIFDCHQESSEPQDTCDTTLTDAQSHPSLPIIDVVTVTTPPKVAGPPPPLPPRHHRQSSEDNSSTSNRLSLTLDEPPKLPARPHLPPRSEIYALSERSDKSVKSEKSEKSEDHTDDGSVPDTTHIKPLPNETVTSYESYEDDTGAISQDSDLMSKLNIKLPMPLNRKKKKRNAYSKSQSSSQWDLNLSFRDLVEVSICGELNIHGKLTWSRRLVAVTNRRLLCYKPEKMSKPTLVVQLLGYQATYNEREKHKGYEILLHHPLAENYVFGVELLEWAQSWCEYIQAACEGKDPPGRALRLYRHSGSYLTDLLYRTKSDPRSASSNSIASSDGSSTSRKDFRSGRMTLAQRASTFLAKKKASKKMTVIGIPAEILNEARPRPLTHPSTGSLERRYEGFPRSLSDEPPARSQTLVDTTVSQKGYVHVYSSFNRKRIGKRWCVVRGNHFECYPSEKSQVCEMRFPLNICTFRQAKEETNSEKGIMIVENDAEKITVEPVEFESLDDWISVLLRETLCDKVPEGLDKYYTEKTYEVPPEDLASPVDDPDDPYACINDLSVENAVDESEDQRMAKENEENLRVNSSENSENKENQSTSKPKNIADMYSPVLWENKRRNSSKSSIKSEKENLSQSPQTGENQSLNSLDPGNNSQSTTPDGQPLKPLYSAAVTDSGYTTASSPTSSNQQPLDEVGNTESNRTVTSPSQPASMSSLLKRWDVKTKIQNLEKGVSDHKHSRQKSPKPKTPDACVKTKVFSFEKKTCTTTPTPTPPKRKRSNSKNNALKVKNSSPKLLKPVSLDFETSSAKSEKTTKDIQPGEINTDNSNKLSPKDVPEEKIDNSKAAFSEQSSAPLLPLRQDSMTSSYDTDSCVTDSSDSALRSEHETPTNSDVESWNLSKNEGPEYKNAPDESPLFSFDYFSTSGERGLPGNRGSREGTVERLSSRESSTEPTTSCSSWDSSQETNCYNFGYDSSSDANPEEPDEIFLTETQTNCEKTLSKDLNVSRSSENSVSSEVTLLSNKTLSVDSLDNGCHNQNNEDLVFSQNSTEDTTDLPCKLSTLRTELVKLKKNRIQARDKKLRARGEKELTACEEKFEALDKSCKLIAQQITELEGRIKLSGSDLTQSSEA